MHRDIKFSSFFILVAFVLLGLTTCKPKNEMDSSKKVSAQVLSASDKCNAENYKYPKDKARADSSTYNAVIDIITPPSVFATIENPTVGYFPISLSSIEALKQMEEKCEILPEDGHDDPSWFYFAIKPGVKPERDTITAYFVCYKGKKDLDNHCVRDGLIYFDLSNPNRLITISPQNAEEHMRKFQNYIDKRINESQSLELFYPHGFQLPWCDLLAVGENLGTNKDNRVNCVLVIKSKRDDPSVPAVSMVIRTFKQKKSTGEAATEGDDDEYYDFVYPCPTSCIP